MTIAENINQNNNTCSANSFMLRDSVCDEATNIALCLYDGGDCCLEAKDTTLCKNCSCMLLVTEDDLQNDFDTWEIHPLDTSIDFSTVISNTNSSVKVEEVVSSPVCSVLCLDHKKFDRINAWQYDAKERVCTCGWIQSTTCLEADLWRLKFRVLKVRT